MPPVIHKNHSKILLSMAGWRQVKRLKEYLIRGEGGRCPSAFSKHCCPEDTTGSCSVPSVPEREGAGSLRSSKGRHSPPACSQAS